MFKLFESQNITSHLIFVKTGPTLSLSFYGQNKSKSSHNLFHVFLNNPIDKKTDPLEKNLRWSKIGGGSRVGMTAVKDSMFFKASALWANAFYKSKCTSVCPSVRPSVHF